MYFYIFLKLHITEMYFCISEASHFRNVFLYISETSHFRNVFLYISESSHYSNVFLYISEASHFRNFFCIFLKLHISEMYFYIFLKHKSWWWLFHATETCSVLGYYNNGPCTQWLFYCSVFRIEIFLKIDPFVLISIFLRIRDPSKTLKAYVNFARNFGLYDQVILIPALYLYYCEVNQSI